MKETTRAILSVVLSKYRLANPSFDRTSTTSEMWDLSKSYQPYRGTFCLPSLAPVNRSTSSDRDSPPSITGLPNCIIPSRLFPYRQLAIFNQGEISQRQVGGPVSKAQIWLPLLSIVPRIILCRCSGARVLAWANHRTMLPENLVPGGVLVTV